MNMLQLRVGITCLGEQGKNTSADEKLKISTNLLLYQVLYHLVLINIVKTYDFIFTKKLYNRFASLFKLYLKFF